MLDRFDKALAAAEEKVREKGWGIAGSLQLLYGLFEDEEAAVYHQVITDPVTYGSNEALGKMLRDAFSPLLPKQTLTPDLFHPRVRENIPPSDASSKSPYAQRLMSTLCTWVNERKKSEGNSARARVILGVNNFCILILGVGDPSLRIAAWEKNSEIMEAIALSKLSTTTTFIDSKRKLIGGVESESHIHYVTAMRSAEKLSNNNIRIEKVAQTQTTIQTDLEGLHDNIEGLTKHVILRMIYGLFIDSDASFELSLDEIYKHEAGKDLVPTFITAILFQIMGYNFGEIPAGKLNFSAPKDQSLTMDIIRLNDLIRALQGDEILKKRCRFTGQGALTLLSSRSNSRFVAQLLQWKKEKKLLIQRNKNVVCIGIRSRSGGHDRIRSKIHSIPSGFGITAWNEWINSESKKNQDREAVQEIKTSEKKQSDAIFTKFMNITAFTQQIINYRFQLSGYIQLVSCFGSDGTLLLFGSSLYERILKICVLVNGLIKELTDTYTYYKDLLSRLTDSRNVRNNSPTRKKILYLYQIKTTINDILLPIQANVIQYTNEIQKKCEAAAAGLAGLTVYQQVSQTFLDDDDRYCDLQASLGMSIEKLTKEQKNQYLKNAKEMDQAREHILSDLKESSQPADDTWNRSFELIEVGSSRASADRTGRGIVVPYRSARSQPRSVSSAQVRAVFSSSMGVIQTLTPSSSPAPSRSSSPFSSRSSISVDEQMQEADESSDKPLRLTFASSENERKIKDILDNIKIELEYQRADALATDPVEWLAARYPLPQRAPQHDLKYSVDDFFAEMDFQEQQASLLKSNISNLFWYYINPIEWYRNYKGRSEIIIDRNINRAARLAICKNMSQLFLWTLNEEKTGNLDQKKIELMYARLKTLLDTQKSWLGTDSFNVSLKIIAAHLTEHKAILLRQLSQLNKSKLSIESLDNEPLKNKISVLKNAYQQLMQLDNQRYLYARIKAEKDNIKQRIDLLLESEYGQIESEIQIQTQLINQERIVIPQAKQIVSEDKKSEAIQDKISNLKLIVTSLNEVMEEKVYQAHLLKCAEKQKQYEELLQSVTKKRQKEEAYLKNYRIAEILKGRVISQMTLITSASMQLFPPEFKCLNFIWEILETFIRNSKNDDLSFETMQRTLLTVPELKNQPRRIYSQRIDNLLQDISNEFNLASLCLDEKGHPPAGENKVEMKLISSDSAQRQPLPAPTLNKIQQEKIQCIIVIAKKFIHEKLDEYIAKCNVEKAFAELKSNTRGQPPMAGMYSSNNPLSHPISCLTIPNGCPADEKQKAEMLFRVVPLAYQCLRNVNGAVSHLKKIITQIIRDLETNSLIYRKTSDDYVSVLRAIVNLIDESFGLKNKYNLYARLNTYVAQSRSFFSFFSSSILSTANELEERALIQVRGSQMIPKRSLISCHPLLRV